MKDKSAFQQKIIEFQKETKANKLFSYLGGGADEQQTSQ